MRVVVVDEPAAERGWDGGPWRTTTVGRGGRLEGGGKDDATQVRLAKGDIYFNVRRRRGGMQGRTRSPRGASITNKRAADANGGVGSYRRCSHPRGHSPAAGVQTWRRYENPHLHAITPPISVGRHMSSVHVISAVTQREERRAAAGEIGSGAPDARQPWRGFSYQLERGGWPLGVCSCLIRWR